MAASREIARRNARIAQVAAVALLAAAGVGAVAKIEALTKVTPPALPPAVTNPAATSDQPAAPEPVELDTMLLTSILWEHGNPPLEESEPQPTDTTTASATSSGSPAKSEEPVTPVAKSGWRYIGHIIGPRTTHALLERDTLQRLVAAGDRIDGTRVLEVHKDFVLLDDGSGPKRVDLAPPTSERWQVAATRNTSAAPSRPYSTNGQVTRPPGAVGARSSPGIRPPAVPQARPIEQRSEEIDEMQMKLEELRRQQEEAGQTGAMVLPADESVRRVASITGGRR